jgi:hypothetical protein
MTRFNRAALVTGVLCVVAALPALAAEPTVSKSILGADNGSSVLVITFSGADQAVYGVTLTDASASFEDIVVPEGWVGIATDDTILLRTLDTPITSDKSATFRVVTKNANAALSATYRDLKTTIGSKQDI